MLMKPSCRDFLNELICDYPELEVCKESVEEAFNIMKKCYINGGKVLICGNGGSAADSEHIVGELMKGFQRERRISEEDAKRIWLTVGDGADYICSTLQGSLPAISLTSHIAVSSAYINDVAADMVFAQQVYGYAQEGDVLMGLSTSGNSANVVYAVKVAKAFGVKTIGMTGTNGGRMKDLCDIAICVPSDITYKIQEYHLPVYHTICSMLEAEFFDK